VNEEALAQWGLTRQKKQKYKQTIVVVVVVVAVIVVVRYCLITDYWILDVLHLSHATPECRIVAMFITVKSQFFIHGALRPIHSTPDMPSSNGVLVITIRKQITRKLHAATKLYFTVYSIFTSVSDSNSVTAQIDGSFHLLHIML
jgi:hypothetical protein